LQNTRLAKSFECSNSCLALSATELGPCKARTNSLFQCEPLGSNWHWRCWCAFSFGVLYIWKYTIQWSFIDIMPYSGATRINESGLATKSDMLVLNG